MENRQTLTERLCGMDKSLKKEDILLPIGFDLTPTASRKKTDGIAVLLWDRISV